MCYWYVWLICGIGWLVCVVGMCDVCGMIYRTYVVYVCMCVCGVWGGMCVCVIGMCG